jgi:nicotinamide phosphoribosyltransferase
MFSTEIAETADRLDAQRKKNITNAVKAIMATDGYKLDHRRQYPEGTEHVYANWTPRGSRIPEVTHVTFVGLQYAIKKHLMENFEAFFAADVDEVCAEYQRMLDNYLGPNDIGTDHIRALHNLGYIPLEFKALPEGTAVPLRVPMFTVENTHPEFFWLTNYFETILSAELWMPMTSATIASRIRRSLNEWAVKTGESVDGVGFQGHDFSMRGMAGLEAAILSGMGHLVAFTGTETVPVLAEIEQYYPMTGFLAGTVPATEHSVMCAGGQEDERETFKRLLNLYPTQILSVVSDTWDFWNVMTVTLPSLKDEILERGKSGAKLVVRPDSGDPADIICGTYRHSGGDSIFPLTPEKKGAIEILWDTFGGTVNEAGYKVLNPAVGLIYGDAMNFDRINDINQRLADKGFASTNWVAGIGSFNYQYQTRDTFGFAMKATNVIINGVEKPIFKDPKTDNGLKKSLKGRIAVTKKLRVDFSQSNQNGLVNHTADLVAQDDSVAEQRDKTIAEGKDLLETVWKDGKFVKEITFDEIRANAGF